jgi:hypothetical protein
MAWEGARAELPVVVSAGVYECGQCFLRALICRIVTDRLAGGDRPHDWQEPGRRGDHPAAAADHDRGLPENFYQHVFRAGVPPNVDWVRTILHAGQDKPVGVFQYSNGSSHLLAAALRQAVGRPVLDYARDKLFTPLGIDTTAAPNMVARPDQLDIYDAAGFVWPVDPQGVHLGSGGQKLTATDLAKLGRLWLNHGRWNGHHIVPASWLDASTSRQVTPPHAATTTTATTSGPRPPPDTRRTRRSAPAVRSSRSFPISIWSLSSSRPHPATPTSAPTSIPHPRNATSR